ncbi:MAG: sigma-54-dependent Fis family transcriptional regulator [Fidelibacterota bacterium]|nr:MAG: sigma-54-dependent Fis family transcriptional regulator [Candidatus Neomarinimicrobiota bacterium]
MSAKTKPYQGEAILIVDDDPVMLKSLEQAIKKAGYTTLTATTLTECLELAGSDDVGLILLDVVLPEGSSVESLPEVLQSNPALKVIMVTASSSIDQAVEAMKKGAYDYLTKPIDFDVLLIAIEHALDMVRADKEIARLRDNLKGRYRFENIIGESPAMLNLFDGIERVLNNPVTILLQAESGTGKELVAKAIHYNGNRSGAAFIAVNCAAIPPSLIESELFGHEKGAFTGAVARHPGKFEQANEGTIFLDEVGEMPLESQARFLRVLQERELVRVGGRENVKINVRVIAATNKLLNDLVEEKRFREDLYYRLSVFPLKIPPLRERRTDIPLLTAHFLEQYKRDFEFKGDIGVSPDAMNRLVHYTWPGNVRELENVLQRALLLTDDGHISVGHLPLELEPSLGAGMAVGEGGVLVADPVQGGLRPFDEIEKDVLVRALEVTQGNITSAATQLGLGRTTLYRKMKKYGLDQPI